MSKVRICFEINGLSADENGLLCPTGMQIALSETNVDYETLTKNINASKILEFVSLTGLVKPEDLKIITPEEFDEKYGDKKE